MWQVIKCVFGFHEFKLSNPIGKWFLRKCYHCDHLSDFVAINDKEAAVYRDEIRKQTFKENRNACRH